MARPKNKQELIEAANTNYEKLLSMIERRTEAEKSAPYDFLDDEKKKEAHWRRDRNLRDVLIHLNEWHLLLLEWVKTVKTAAISHSCWKDITGKRMVI